MNVKIPVAMRKMLGRPKCRYLEKYTTSDRDVTTMPSEKTRGHGSYLCHNIACTLEFCATF